MKKLLSLILILVLCLTFTACQTSQKTVDVSKLDNITEAQAECSELEIRQLIERNLDCYFLFYVAPLSSPDGEPDEDGYCKADTSYFQSYEELENLIYSTYTAEKAAEILSYPEKDKPLYKNVDGDIYVNEDVIKPKEYEILWDDFDLELTESTKTQCNFNLYTTDFYSNEYNTDGFAVHQGDKWLLTYIIH